jgi:hypothetical protein
MRTYHVEATVQTDGRIVLSQSPFKPGEKVEITVVSPAEDSSDKAWTELTQAEFLRGYSDEDSIYDSLQ